MLTISTPAILFPATSLILLAYTAKMIQLANLIRSLKKQYLADRDKAVLSQIVSLRRRIYLIRNMQACGILSFITGGVCMMMLFWGFQLLAEYIFGLSLTLLLISLFLSFKEIRISVSALNIELGLILKSRKL